MEIMEMYFMPRRFFLWAPKIPLSRRICLQQNNRSPASERKYTGEMTTNFPYLIFYNTYIVLRDAGLFFIWFYCCCCFKEIYGVISVTIFY